MASQRFHGWTACVRKNVVHHSEINTEHGWFSWKGRGLFATVKSLLIHGGKSGRGLRLALPCLAALLACTAAKTPSSFQRTSPNGQTLFEVGLKRGLPDGVGTTHHLNGVIANKGPYESGKRHGLFQFWNDEGLWLRQEFYISGHLGWTSTEFGELSPTEAEIVDEIAAKQLAGEKTSPGPKHSWIDEYIPPPPRTRFISGLEGHGSFAQATIGRGSNTPSSEAQRLSARGSLAKGRLGASVAFVVARYADNANSAWAKPVAETQISYLLPHWTGMFIARAGFVFPLGNDSNKAALAGGASAHQSPNDVIYVVPSTLATRGSISWFGGSEYVRTQIDLGIDVGFGGYGSGYHPIFHANGVAGIGARGLLVAAEVSSAIGLSDTIASTVLSGFALYGTLRKHTIGVFAGRGDSRNVVRLRVARDF